MITGGKRVGSGRKTVTDKKETVTIYVEKSKIDKLGLDKLKEICYKAINEAIS